jgi:hypothetical protein
MNPSITCIDEGVWEGGGGVNHWDGLGKKDTDGIPPSAPKPATHTTHTTHTDAQRLPHSPRELQPGPPLNHSTVAAAAGSASDSTSQ